MTSLLDKLQDAFSRLAPPQAPAVETEASAARAGAMASVPGASCECQAADAKVKGYHLNVFVSANLVVRAAEVLDRHGFAIDAITGVDWMAAGEMEVVYDFNHLATPLQVVVRTRVPRDNPEVLTISGVFPGANWHERETHEFFGIRFAGHPNLTPLLLPEDATYHPLRKDFTGVS